MRNVHWSLQARDWLAGQQAELYSQLGQQMGLGPDPATAFLKLSRPQMPAGWIAPNKFESTFARDWSQAPGWGDHGAAIDGFLELRQKLELPTPYEDVNRYPMLVEMAMVLEQSLENARLPMTFRPLLGSLPSGEINAMSVLLRETGEYVVLFEHGLFEFTFRLAKVIAMLFPRLVPDGSGARFESDPAPKMAVHAAPDTVDRFVDVVGAYVLHGNPHRACAFDLAKEHTATAMTMVRTIEMFVLGHEYAHVFLGHLNEPNPVPSTSDAMDTSWSWDQEYAADHVGWSLAERALQFPWPLSYLGPEVFFGGTDCLDRCVALLEGLPPEDIHQSDTHPPMPLRRDRLRMELPEILPAELSHEAALRLGEAVQEAFDALWAASVPRWRALHDGGARPSVLWSS